MSKIVLHVQLTKVQNDTPNRVVVGWQRFQGAMSNWLARVAEHGYGRVLDGAIDMLLISFTSTL